MPPNTPPPTPPNETLATSWSLAVMLLTRWLENDGRADTLLETLPPGAIAPGAERARCQNLLYGAIRHKGRIEAHLKKLIERTPRPRLKAILLVTGYELLDDPAAKIPGETDDAGDDAKAAAAKTAVAKAAAASAAAIAAAAAEAAAAKAAEAAKVIAAATAKIANENNAANPASANSASAKPGIAKPPGTKAAARAARATAAIAAKAAEAAENAARAERAGQIARIVHHAVEQTKTLASMPEARMVNAVARKLAALLASEPPPPKFANAVQLATWYSHPPWLVQRWLAQFGALGARALLEWNQRPATVHARWRANAASALPAWLGPTAWENFHEVRPGHWPEVEAALAAGDLYLQDPSTRLAIELLAPQAGERILDACAAPGGKTIAIADKVARTLPPAPDNRENSGMGENASAAPSAAPPGATLIVALDLPDARIDRLKENLARIPAGADVKAVLLEGDLLRAEASLFTDRRLPAEYDAVLLDAPCSNTGVMRHRVDVKWRLQPNDFTKHARQQLALLESASRRVTAGGRLVYSTCSIDAEENERVVESFLKSAPEFALERPVISHPWVAGHDGAAAFLLRRK